MTIFNSAKKIGRRFVSELENLKLWILEQSFVSEKLNIKLNVENKKGTNSISKLRRRTLSELQHLKMEIIEESYVAKNSKFKLNFRDSEYNTIAKIRRNKVFNHDGLLIYLFEKSMFRKDITVRKVRVFKALKQYKLKIKHYFKYDNNVKY